MARAELSVTPRTPGPPAPGTPAPGAPGGAGGTPVDARERRDELTVRARAYARGARSSSTWAAYERQWRRFETWCAGAGEPALPAEPLTVARFLADLAPVWRPATPADPPEAVVEGQVCVREGLRPGSLRGYLAAISVAHATGLAPEAPNPTRAEVVRRTMAGIARHPGVGPARRRAAARRDDIVAILAAMDPDRSLADARDTALVLLGWKAALRASDLAGMRLEDQRVTEAGLAVHLRRSKTDQAGSGTTVGVTAPEQGRGADGGLDAVAAWRRWTRLLGGHGLVTGPAWRGVDRYGRRPRAGGLTRNSIRLIVVRRAEAAGLDPRVWGAHSLRRGFATEAIALGVPERDVQRHGRWRSRAAMDPYIAQARTFDTTNPTRWLG